MCIRVLLHWAQRTERTIGRAKCLDCKPFGVGTIFSLCICTASSTMKSWSMIRALRHYSTIIIFLKQNLISVAYARKNTGHTENTFYEQENNS